MALTRDKFFWESFSAHIECTERAVALLAELLGGPEHAAILYERIHDIEHEGDKITREVVQALHKTWITPLDRDAIHGLITCLDTVLDEVDACAVRFSLYEITEIRPEARAVVELMRRSIQIARPAIDNLTNMKESAHTLELCSQLNQLESQADRVYREAVARLFKEATDPILAMKWRDIFDALEAVHDSIENVADIIEGIVLEHS